MRAAFEALTNPPARPFLKNKALPTPAHVAPMQARAHLKLIVSGAASEEQPERDEVAQDRVSMVQPLSSARLRLQWLRAHQQVLALWSASVVLLSVAALVALGWL